uniref:AD domain-containing protein n=1 Tax=Trichobilharzia regenti TaxID=157069 RepID=A0AA85J4M1_TRIRE|nr:unnamed protein product [Trichobilharzia regenti]
MEMPTVDLSLIRKKVQLNCIGDKVFSGFVYTIDPITGNYVLYSCTNGTYLPTIVRFQAVKSVEVLDDEIPSELNDLFDTLSPESSSSSSADELEEISSELKCRQEIILQLFSANHIQGVTVNARNEIIIHNAVCIKPPYTVDCCLGKNVMALESVRNLLGELDEKEIVEETEEDGEEVVNGEGIVNGKRVVDGEGIVESK